MKRVIKIFIFILFLSIVGFIVNAFDEYEMWHNADTIMVEVEGFNVTLEEAINNGYYSGPAMPKVSSPILDYGHLASEILITTTNGHRMTLQEAFDNYQLEFSTRDYTTKLLGGHLASEIEIMGGLSLQDIVNNNEIIKSCDVAIGEICSEEECIIGSGIVDCDGNCISENKPDETTCSGGTCFGGVCYLSHDYVGCYDGDEYWYGAYGNIEDKKLDCGSSSCGTCGCTFMGDMCVDKNPLGLSSASFIGEYTSDYSGYSVSTAGDVNNDGYDDILIGAYGYDSDRLSPYPFGGAGKTYLIFGNSSGWDTNIDLSDIAVSFIGENEEDESGTSVSTAGDVNNDGYDDILIGSYVPNGLGGPISMTYLIFGKSSGWGSSIDLSNANVSFSGDKISSTQFGPIVSTAGDVNNDGYDDILIKVGYSTVYLFLGKATSDWESNIDLLNADASFVQDPRDFTFQFANSVSSAGDVNNDGYDDILIGSPGALNEDRTVAIGKAYLILGRNTVGWKLNMVPSKIGISFNGVTPSESAGTSVSSAGDVNNDGYDDILIGAPLYPVAMGKTYLIFGKSSWGSNIDLSNADVSFIGEYAHSYTGTLVSSAGDVNNDGYDDILIGMRSNGNALTYLVLGKSSGWGLDMSLSNADASFMKEKPGERISSMSPAGDINGDGRDDILLGSYMDDAGGQSSGKTYLILV